VSKFGSENVVTRERWLEKTIKKIPRGSKILDAGAGELKYKYLCKNLKYVSQDFAQYNGGPDDVGLQTGKWDNSKIDIVSDIIKIPVEKESFDAIMCIEVFEHLPEPALAVKEFSRIIKKGGSLVLTAPFASLTHFAPYYYANGYSRFWYEEILEKNGFKIKEMTFNGNYFEYIAQELKRIRFVEAKYAGTKLSRNPIFRFAINVILEFLEKMSLKDKKSKELLCFGIHILAIKEK